MPSPNNIMSMVNGSSYGFRRSLGFNLGIWLGLSLVALLCTVVSNAVYGLLPSIALPVKVLGAAYMLYLGWKIFTFPTQLDVKHTPCLFASGMLLQFINVKYYVYCLVSMLVYILPHYQGNMPVLVLFALLLSTLGFAFALLWAWGGASLRVFFSRYGRAINVLLALCMLYCAVSLFY